MEQQLLLSLSKSIVYGEIVCLDLSNKQLTDSDFATLASALSSNSSLVQKIVLDNNDLSAAGYGDGLAAFVKAMNSNKRLIALSLNCTNLQNHTFIEFVKLVISQPFTELQYLSLCNTNLTADAVDACCHLIKSSPNLQVLKLSSNEIGDEGCIMLAAAVNLCQSLLCLELENVGISNIGLQCLTAALEYHRKLRVLDVSYNKVGDIGAIALARLLEGLGYSLREIKANACEIQNFGAEVLFRAIKSNSSLRKISLAANLLDEANGLDDLVKTNRSLEGIDLSENAFAFNSLNSVFACLASNHVLNQIELDKNLISSEGARELAKYLPANQGLLMLDLSDNCINARDAKLILEATIAHPSLVWVDLSSNCFDVEELEQIVKQRGPKRIKYILQKQNSEPDTSMSVEEAAETHSAHRIANVI